MFKKITDSLTNLLNKNYNLDTKELAYFNFGLKVVIGVIIEVLIMLTIAYLFNIFWPVLIASISFLVIRPYGGGVHLPTYFSCMIVTLIIFLSIGFITSRVETNLISTLIIILSVSISGFILLNKYAPADTKTIPISDPEQRKVLKSKAKTILYAWTIISITASFITNKHLDLIFASSLGMFSQLISTHPIFFYIAENYLGEHD